MQASAKPSSHSNGPLQDIQQLQEYLELLHIDSDTKQALRTHKPLFNQIMPKALDAFYEMITNTPALRSRVSNLNMVPRLKEAQNEHWNILFNGQFNDNYLQRSHMVALAHQKIDLQAGAYCSGYFFVALFFVKQMFEHFKQGSAEAASVSKLEEAILSFLKVVFLDTAFVLNEFNLVGKQHLEGKNDTLSGHLAEMPREVEHIYASIQQSNNEVENVSKAIDELGDCLNHLSSNSNKAVDVSNETRQLTDKSQTAMGELIKSANEINQVIELIRGVAEQTNLLALNATIQASRAGEAGRGFQVVANEIKKLSASSAESTEQIRNKVEEIQSRISIANTNMQQISQLMGDLSVFNETIASAIEEQGMSTYNIGQSMTQLASSSKSIEGSVLQLAEHTNSIQECLH